MLTENAVILITRPKAQAEPFAKACRGALGEKVEIIISPLMEIEFPPLNIPIEKYSGLVFSSQNAVQAYLKNCENKTLPAFCVGRRTASAAKDAGLQAISADGDADDLVDLIAKENPKGRLLHIHGQETRGNIVPRLNACGIKADSIIAYQQTPVALSDQAQTALAGEKCVILPLFSPRTACLFFDNAKQINAPLRCIVISEAVKAAIPVTDSLTVVVAQTPDAVAMLRAIVA